MAIDTIKSSAVLDGAIATADIADDAVTSAKLGSGAVDTTALGASAVTNAKIANSTLDLTAKVTGALPVANGGTALTTGFINGGMVQSSAVTTSGAATYQITGVPTTAQKIILNLYGVKPAASGTTRYLEWRLLDSGGSQVQTNYFSHQEYSSHGGNANISYSNNVNSFRLNGWSNENNVWYGTIYFELYSTNIWQMRGNLWTSGFTQYLLSMSGFCSTANTNPSGVWIGTSTGGNFDSGQFTVSYI